MDLFILCFKSKEIILSGFYTFFHLLYLLYGAIQ